MDSLFIEAQGAALGRRAGSHPREAPGIHVCDMGIGGKTPILSRGELSGIGFGGIIYANAALQASLLAMRNVLGHIQKHGSIAGAEAAIISFDDRQQLVDFERFKALERRYATD